MKFTNLRIENFMAIGEAEIKLADRGMILIEGVNNVETSAKSNGAGKSSIADALSWCLFGITARGEDTDNVINLEAGKNCRVQVDVEDGDDVFRIARHRKHAKGKNSVTVHSLAKDGTMTDLTKGTDKLTQDVVNQIIGCSVDVFNGAVYAGQERMPDLPGMTDKMLKMLIEEASGATLLEAAYKEANLRLGTAKTMLLGAEAEVGAAERRLGDTKTRLHEAEGEKISFEIRRKTDLHSLATQAKGEKTVGEELAKKLAELGDIAAVQAELDKIDAAIAAVDGERAEELRLAEALDLANRQFSKADALYAAAVTASQRDLDRLAGLDHQIGCPCETCDRPFSAEDIAPAKKLAEEQVAKSKAAQLAARKTVDELEERAQSARDALKSFRATMTDLSATSAQRAPLQQRLHDISVLQAKIDGSKKLMVSYVQRIKAKRDEANPWDAEIEKLEKMIEAAKVKVIHTEVVRDSAIEQLKVAELTAKVFSPAGVRAFLLDEVTPFLNEQTAKYLGTLSDGHISATWSTLVKNGKGELKEKFSIEVENQTGGKTFKGISGGEKRKVRIACALALQDLVARRATKPIELFIGDEIDDALDAAGQERLISILEEKARERGSVFIISHNDLKDWCRNIITVRKDGPRSTIEESVS